MPTVKAIEAGQHIGADYCVSSRLLAVVVGLSAL